MAWKYEDLLNAGRANTIRELTPEEMMTGLLPEGYGAVKRYDPYGTKETAYRGSWGVGDNAFLNDDDWNAVQRYKAQYEQAKAAGDQAGMNAAHEAAQQLRYKYGYSGGADGSEYNSIIANVQGVPEYRHGNGDQINLYAEGGNSGYGSQIDALLNGILNREGFSYDKNTDPLYQQYMESYTRGGKLAMQDVLAELSARTGGLASSYAGGASQQTFNNYMAQLADKVPELYEMRYNMYLNELEQQRKDLETVLGVDDMYYGRSRDEVADSQWQQQFDYNKQQDEMSWYYKLMQDALANGGLSSGTASGGEVSDWRNTGKRGGWYDNGDLTTEQVKKLQEVLGVDQDGKYGALSQQEAGNDMSAREAYDYYVGGAGLNADHFNASMRSIAQQLAAGKKDAAEGNVDRIWDELSGAQREDLIELLGKYGWQID